MDFIRSPVSAALSVLLGLHGLRSGSLDVSGALAAIVAGDLTLGVPDIKLFGVLMIAFYLAGSRATKCECSAVSNRPLVTTNWANVRVTQSRPLIRLLSKRHISPPSGKSRQAAIGTRSKSCATATSARQRLYFGSNTAASLTRGHMRGGASSTLATIRVGCSS